MRIAILGMGAVGGYFGARLLQAGGKVVFLRRRGRAAEELPRRLRLSSPLGDWEGGVTVCPVDEFDDAVDVVLVALKAFDLEPALASIAHLVAGGAQVLPMLNGVRHIDVIARRFPTSPSLGGLAHLMVSHDGRGHITHGNSLHHFRFGQISGAADDVLDALAALAQAAHVDAVHTPTVQAQMWSKFQMLAAFSAMCCLTRASVGQMMAADNGKRLMERALEETALTAAAEGHACPASHLDETRQLLTQAASPFNASMLRDLLAARRTEAEHIVGDMVRRARQHGLDTPLLECGWAALQVHEIQMAVTNGSPALQLTVAANAAD